MDIQGSCYCGRVHFRAVSHTPYPYMRCYCSICRKSAGGGGYAINIMAESDSLHIEGGQHLGYHHGRIDDTERPGHPLPSPGKRYFCNHCGSALWVADPRWPQSVYPFASAVDTALPVPPEVVHIMLDFAAPWVQVPTGDNHRHFKRYPDESILAWHQRQGLYQGSD